MIEEVECFNYCGRVAVGVDFVGQETIPMCAVCIEEHYEQEVAREFERNYYRESRLLVAS